MEVIIDGVRYAPAEEKKETVKLYCVKSYKPGEWLTRGKVYERDGDKIVFDNQYEGSYSMNLGENPTASYFAHLVSRPAKVGEWVYVTKKPISMFNNGQITDGNVVKITRYGTMPSVMNSTGDFIGFRDDEYLVIDGYKPEPERCKCCGRVMGE